MNILYYCWNENSAADIEQAFSNAGFSFVKVTYRPNSYDADPILEQQIDDLLHQYKFDCIYTFNYVPILSEIAQNTGFPILHGFTIVQTSPYTPIPSPMHATTCFYLIAPCTAKHVLLVQNTHSTCRLPSRQTA